MSNFICEKCGKEIIDTENGYITECEHYPLGIIDQQLTKMIKKGFLKLIPKLEKIVYKDFEIDKLTKLAEIVRLNENEQK